MSRCSAPCCAAADTHKAMPSATTAKTLVDFISPFPFPFPFPLLLSLGLQPLLFQLRPRSRAESHAARGKCRGHISAVAAVLERRHVDRDRVADFDQVVSVPRAIHVVGAMSFERDIAFTLGIFHVEHEL